MLEITSANLKLSKKQQRAKHWHCGKNLKGIMLISNSLTVCFVPEEGLQNTSPLLIACLIKQINWVANVLQKRVPASA